MVFREALEEVLAEHLNAGHWENLPFSDWGVGPNLPGQMVFSIDMAERPESGGLRDAYIVFNSLTGSDNGAIILTGAPGNARFTVDEAKKLIVRAIEERQVYSFD